MDKLSTSPKQDITLHKRQWHKKAAMVHSSLEDKTELAPVLLHRGVNMCNPTEDTVKKADLKTKEKKKKTL